MELLTTISAEYVPDWGFYEGVRELIQNGLDASDKGFRFDIVYLREREELLVYNEGTYLTRSNLLLGNTSKRDDETQRGMYGEGFKIGLLALIRCGKEVSITNGLNNEIITPGIGQHPDYGNMNVLSFRTDQSNILPIDSKKLIFKVGNVKPVEVKEIKHKFLHWEGLELGDYYKTDLGKVLTQDQYKGKVYNRGIYVCDIEKLTYGYDIDTLPLGRDRNLASQHDICWETSRMWGQIGSQHSKDELVIKMLESKAPDIQSIKYWTNDKLTNSIFDDFQKTNDEKAYPCSSEYQRKEVASLGYKPVFVSEQHSEIIREKLPSIDSLKEKAALKQIDDIDITQVFFRLIGNGWKIKHYNCDCGGKYVWLKPDDEGDFKIAGCICHNTPTEESC